VGEAQDALIISDPKSSTFDVGAAGVSLLLNQLTAGLLPNFGAVLKGVGTADPSLIRFSQNSIGRTFSDGRSLDALVAGLKNGTIKPGDVPAIRVFEQNGQWFTLDNRRLQAFRQAGVDVPFRLATTEEILEASRHGKFNSPDGGLSIRIRGGG
jgi:hypothetical protein